MEKLSYNHVDPAEMELRNDADYIASLDMIDEGAPVFEAFKHRTGNNEGFGEEDLPAAYQ